MNPSIRRRAVARSPSPPSVEVGPHGRILALSAAWFSDGARRRAEARRAARCVECGTELPNHRTPYCSRRCQWKFHGHYFWDSARSYVMLRDRYTCRVCGDRHRARDLEVDHIVEVVLGGAALEYSNLQTVCRACHRAKTQAFNRTRSPSSAAERVAESPITEGSAPISNAGAPRELVD